MPVPDGRRLQEFERVLTLPQATVGAGHAERPSTQTDRRLLDEADEAIGKRDWTTVREAAQAVLALDPSNADAQTFLAAVERAEGARAQQSEPAPPAPPPSQPTSFCDGRYEVKKFLGEGGKKRVFLAHDSLLDRDVAFALIKTEGLDDVGRERIRREAQAMGRLGAHPHVVSVFDLGETGSPSTGSGGPQPFIVTEFMAGGDVERLIENAPAHRMPLAEALRIADEVCQGLDFAHGKQIVHRDLKPGNVWLTADGTAKIGDFGLAVATDRARLTQPGLMVGTVSYMPPEQALGGGITPRSDLYSLGAMLYELLTGRPPFVGDESVAIITQHLNTPPVALSWHVSDLPPTLEALVLRLLEKDPSKRPASAGEVRGVLADIRRQIEGRVSSPTAQPLGIEGQPSEGNPIYRRTFVGREVELNELRAALDSAVSGEGALRMVVGEPGIGKTALCEQLATYAAIRGGRTLVGHCYEEGSLSLPYLAFVEAMRSYVLTREDDELKRDLGSGAADVARIVSEVRERIPVETRAPGDPDEERWRLLQAVVTFLRNAANVQPLLLVLEDLHWADRGTLDLLLHLGRNIAGSRLLVIGTYRDVEVDRTHPLSGALAELRRVNEFGRVLLRGLTADEVHRMLGSVTRQEVRWSLAEAVYRQTEGNPLFIQEVLRYLVEEGLIVHDAGRWRRTGEAALELSIPEGLRDVIGKRLAKLSAECNRLLAVAAVVGREFDLDILRRVAASDDESLLAAIEEALHVGVLEEHARPGAVHYRFAHAFFRQTLYEELIAPRRLRLHQQVARALEAQYATRLEDHAAEMAEHFAQSTDSADLRRAVEYDELAARRASSVYAYSEAVRLLEQALSVHAVVDPDDHRKRCALLLALGEVLGPAGEPERVFGPVADEAFTLAESLGDEVSASRCCELALQAIHRYGGFVAFGAPEYRQWAERADRHAAPGSRGRIYADIAKVVSSDEYQRSGYWDQVRGILEKARRLDDRGVLFRTAATVMRPTYPVHALPEMVKLTEEFTTLPRDGVDVRTVGVILRRARLVYLVAGDRGRAEDIWAQIEQLASRTGDAEAQLWPLEVEALRATLDGELEAAVDVGRRAAERANQLGMGLRARQTREGLTWRPLLYLGRIPETVEDVADRASLVELWTSEPPLRFWDIAVCLGHAGRAGDVRADLAALADRLGVSTSNGVAAHHLARLLELAVLATDEQTATLVLPKLSQTVATMDLYHVNNVGRWAGAAAARSPSRAAARDSYDHALDWATTIRYRPEIALTRLQIAELLLEGGQKEWDEAQMHLDAAIEEFRAMKMEPALERALRHKGLLHA
jgi:serine/threonine protein kinase/tetratricopeptide (TPR) repeat protein